MADLYAENSLTVAIEAGRKAAALGLQQKFGDVHFGDAVAKTVLEANVLIQGHEHEEQPEPLFAADSTNDEKCQSVMACCDELAALSDGVGASEKPELSPAHIAFLLQLLSGAKTLFDLWWQSRK